MKPNKWWKKKKKIKQERKRIRREKNKNSKNTRVEKCNSFENVIHN